MGLPAALRASGSATAPLGQPPTGVPRGGLMRGYAKSVWEIVSSVFDGFSDEGLYVVHEFNFIQHSKEDITN